MRTLVVIQSRLSSSRLPGKALLTLGGLPIVVLAAKRAGRNGQQVVVATSEEAQDDAIAAELEAHGIGCFRGSLDDPLDRFTGATAALGSDDVVVRLTADNVVPDADLVEELVEALVASGAGYLRTAADLPYGLSAEAFTASLLRAAAADATEPGDREHVTPWIRRQTEDRDFKPLALSTSKGGRSQHLRCTVDTLDDYVVAHRAVTFVSDPVAAPWKDLLAAWERAGAAHLETIAGTQANVLKQGPWVMGTVQLGLPYGATNLTGRPDAVQSARLLAAAVAAGVTHLDTARVYGLSEERIGRSLERGLSERVGVVTKIRPLVALPADAAPEWAELEVRLSVEQSLRALRSSRLDALLVHQWSDWGRSGGQVAATLDAIRASGLARVIGASIATPEEFLAALSDRRVGYVQIPFNVLDRRWVSTDVQRARARREDVIVTARSVFLQGLLAAGKNARWPINAGVNVAALTSALARAAANLGRKSIADLSLAYVRGHSFVTSVVLGAETVEQVRDQAVLMRCPPLSASEIEVVNRSIPGGTPILVDPSQWTMES